MKSTKAHTSGPDWYYDTLPGPAFAAALHGLRAQGPVVDLDTIELIREL
jgi:hypothetical protein